jgi:hypothetical protein
MHLVILMVNMLMSRFFGFRHRETEELEEVYRPLDIGAGLGLAFLFALLFSTLLTTIARVLTLPAWLGSITTALSVAACIFLATTWMPFIEHLSLAAPGEMTARGRKATVLLARAIPYLYGLVAVGAAALMATMVLFMISLVLVALATLFGFDSKVISWQTWAWIGGSAGLVLLLAIARTIIMSARLSNDWGLPVWRAFVEPGQKHPAGARFFNPLDATLGRLVLILTVPTAKMRTAAAEMPEKRRISDYRRFDGDIIDLVVSICVAMLVFGLVSAVGTAIISWFAPEALSHLTTSRPAASNADGNSTKMSTADMAMLFGMILLVLPTMLGCVYFLRRLARHSADGEWAQQRWVQWLARLLEVVRIVSCGLIALVFGGFLALLLDSAAHIGRVGGAVALVVFALGIAYGLLNLPLSEDSYLRTFLGNVEMANRKEQRVPPSS